MPTWSGADGRTIVATKLTQGPVQDKKRLQLYPPLAPVLHFTFL